MMTADSTTRKTSNCNGSGGFGRVWRVLAKGNRESGRGGGAAIINYKLQITKYELQIINYKGGFLSSTGCDMRQFGEIGGRGGIKKKKVVIPTTNLSLTLNLIP